MVIICKHGGCGHRLPSPTLPDTCPKCYGHWLDEGEDYERGGSLIGFRLTCTISQASTEIRLPSQNVQLLGRADFDFIGDRKGYISGRHCRVSEGDGILLVEDLGSTNGTFIGLGNRDALRQKTTLADGAYLLLGREAFLVEYLYAEENEPLRESTPSIPRCVDCMMELVSPVPCVCAACGAWNE